jgi:hypothetical protein
VFPHPDWKSLEGGTLLQGPAAAARATASGASAKMAGLPPGAETETGTETGQSAIRI